MLLLGGCGGADATGFRADIPDGWKDSTRETETRTASDFEGVYEGPKDGDVTTSIAIVRVEAPSGATLESITEQGRRNLRKAYGRAAAAQSPVEVRLAGERAMRLDYDADEARVRQVGALRGGHFFLVSFTAARESFERRLPAFEAMLRSWRWE